MDMEEEDEAIREKAQSLIKTVIRGVKEHLEALQKKEREADYVIGNIQWIACKDFTVERGRQQIEEYISVSVRASQYLTSLPGSRAPATMLWCYLLENQSKKDTSLPEAKGPTELAWKALPLSQLSQREGISYSVVCVQQTWEFHESWLHWSDFLKEEQLKYSKRYHYRVRWSIPTCRKPIPQATACIYFIVEISNIKPPTLPIEVFFILESNRLIHRPGRCRFREKWLKDIIESKMILMESITF